jgi:hypothetical protein
MSQTNDVVQCVRLHLNLRTHQPIMPALAGIWDWTAATRTPKRYVETDRFPRVQLRDLLWATPQWPALRQAHLWHVRPN